MITITRRFEFDAAHRVRGHEGKCKSLHGHRYCCDVTVEAPTLDELGRVIDFGAVKQLIGAWIDENWDHNTLMHCDDALLCYQEYFGRDPYVMDCNPTAENIARELFGEATRLLPRPLRVVRVRVYETPNCWADCSN